MRTIEDYQPFVGNEVIVDLHRKARRLYGVRVIHVNSTHHGGGVAEMLETLVPLMNDVGVEADWRVLHGPLDFFAVTKRFHNALQGEPLELTDAMKEIYVEQNRRFAEYAKLDADLVVIHDPQPLPLIKLFPKRQPWVWRSHSDMTQPDMSLWHFLTGFILRYDMMVVSSEEYRIADLCSPQRVFTPAIDPLAPKNVPMDDAIAEEHLARLGVHTDRPYLLQVSRYDKWKDMEGVLRAYRTIREHASCRVVLCGSSAADDPEGLEVYHRVLEEARDLIESGDAVILSDVSNAEVNALQSRAAVVTQKSKREGFGLTVTEAMWKGCPVVTTDVGGLGLQVEHGVNGLMVPPSDDDAFAEAVVSILHDPDRGAEMGRAGREKVRDNFLVTRLLADYLDMFDELLGYETQR